MPDSTAEPRPTFKRFLVVGRRFPRSPAAVSVAAELRALAAEVEAKPWLAVGPSYLRELAARLEDHRR